MTWQPRRPNSPCHPSRFAHHRPQTSAHLAHCWQNSRADGMRRWHRHHQTRHRRSCPTPPHAALRDDSTRRLCKPPVAAAQGEPCARQKGGSPGSTPQRLHGAHSCAGPSRGICRRTAQTRSLSMPYRPSRWAGYRCRHRNVGSEMHLSRSSRAVGTLLPHRHHQTRHRTQCPTLPRAALPRDHKAFRTRTTS